jgi:hypothetical protein
MQKEQSRILLILDILLDLKQYLNLTRNWYLFVRWLTVKWIRNLEYKIKSKSLLPLSNPEVQINELKDVGFKPTEFLLYLYDDLY